MLKTEKLIVSDRFREENSTDFGKFRWFFACPDMFGAYTVAYRHQKSPPWPEMNFPDNVDVV